MNKLRDWRRATSPESIIQGSDRNGAGGEEDSGNDVKSQYYI